MDVKIISMMVEIHESPLTNLTYWRLLRRDVIDTLVNGNWQNTRIEDFHLLQKLFALSWWNSIRLQSVLVANCFSQLQRSPIQMLFSWGRDI